MPVITLTSDFGLKDHYLAALKGRILSLSPESVIVDISHEITKFDILEASWILSKAWKNFPPGTVHLVAVNSSLSENSPPVALEADGHFFTGPDNGLFSLVLREVTPGALISLGSTGISSFSALEVFAQAAIALAGGEKIEDLGDKIPGLNMRRTLEAFSDNESITGRVVYIDSYENAITNISREQFESVRQSRSFAINIRQSRKYTHESGPSDNSLNELMQTYSDVPEGEILALFNSSGYLEIAINRGNAAGLLGLRTGEIIKINFT